MCGGCVIAPSIVGSCIVAGVDCYHAVWFKLQCTRVSCGFVWVKRVGNVGLPHLLICDSDCGYEL